MFSLALNYKQMELYHALPFFSFLFGKAFRRNSWIMFIFKVCCLGITVIVTFVLCWIPFLRYPLLALRVLVRMFPVGRGLYEDKVANVWCSLSILIKFKDIFSTTTLVKICGCSTVAFVLPSNLMLALRPSPKSFLLALVNSSLAFFLFSYHVHEKSILLVTLPASLLLPLQPLETIWFLFITLFSMIPLLEKDGLLLAYIPCMLLFLLLAFSFHLDLKRTPTTIKFLFFSSIACCILLHVVSHLHCTSEKVSRHFPSINLDVFVWTFLAVFHLLQFSTV
ncbi:dolichyl pyrophosphate Man9 c2 alpha-1,3-glucosyltransferase-like [Paramuricea clavata]|uniref:Alpha-1,3-glucosyltransferase n=1 Tax=Paramuricea clavata TaxID=317549 RepID=A0A6S7HNI9_PARCT|nr:dolichyl pyrophosphate Man9 c2 alpha-1,3-glucosyltransferase-like [Paramuricea clavata]